MEEYSSEILIPEDRVAVLIGSNGKVKKELESAFNSKIFISSDGLVRFKGPDSLKIWTLEKVIKAIGRGFNPEIALLLKDDRYDFDLISISDYSRSKNDMIRLRGRIIGREGKAKSLIEKKTGSHIVVYGKTVGIVAPLDSIEIVRNSIEMLLKGARHVTVFKYIDKENKKRMRDVMFNG